MGASQLRGLRYKPFPCRFIFIRTTQSTHPRTLGYRTPLRRILNRRPQSLPINLEFRRNHLKQQKPDCGSDHLSQKGLYFPGLSREEVA